MALELRQDASRKHSDFISLQKCKSKSIEVKCVWFTWQEKNFMSYFDQQFPLPFIAPKTKGFL